MRLKEVADHPQSADYLGKVMSLGIEAKATIEA